MHHRMVLSAAVVAVGFTPFISPRIVTADDENPHVQDARYYQTQAAEYRREALRLDSAIQRYALMERVYRNGSDRSSGTMNPQGRRLMVERTKRLIHYFTQKQHDIEQRAADYEALAQALPTP